VPSLTDSPDTIPEEDMMTLFGTDGIRGKAGIFPLDERTIRAASAVAGRRLGKREAGGPFLIARDTRVSGLWIRNLVVEELQRLGVAVRDAGVMSTPAAAMLIAEWGCCGGLVISASHNPAADNGLKFLRSDGLKLSEDEEREIESELTPWLPRTAEREATVPLFGMDENGFTADPAAVDTYLNHLQRLIPMEPEGRVRKILVDCANGAAVPAVLALAQRMPGRIVPVAAAPDGMNINRNCGATSPESLAAAVVEQDADLGLSLDGDADRLILADGAGRIWDGDALLYVFAGFLDARRALPDRTVVGTVMTNMGLEIALRRQGIRLQRTPVGDRHIQARMLERGYALGGEPSGHLIVGEYCRTGDGLLAGWLAAHIMQEMDRSWPELMEGYEAFPSRLFNFEAPCRIPPAELTGLARLEERLRQLTGGEARLVARYSGTEPLFRILIEARDLDHILSRIGDLIDEITRQLSGHQ
jgi:phosphoglucosamine mutase